MSVGFLRAILRVPIGVRIGLLLATCGLLSACGGGGGGGGASGGDAYSISPGSVTFTASQGGAAPAPQTVVVRVNSGTVFFLTSQSGNGFSHVFQITGSTTGEITITPDAPVNAGTFTGTITVRGCSTVNCVGSDVAGSPKVINVTYTVQPVSVLSSNPASVEFLTSTGVTPAPQSVSLSLNTGAGSFTSSITYNSGSSNWLVVTPAGALPGSASISVAPVPPVGGHTASITFSAGGVTKVVPVTIIVKSPSANFASPYVATAVAETAIGNVIIRGYGFSAVSAGLQVLFGTTPATSAVVVSDTEIRATYQLAQGSYPITVNSLPSRSSLKLLVVDPPSFGPASIARNFPVSRLIYDAERQSIYAAGDGIERYRFDGTTWVKTSIGLPFSLNFIALAPDGAELISANVSQLARIDPENFSPQSLSFVDAVSLVGTGSTFLADLAFANDGTAIGAIALSTLNNPSQYRFDSLTGQIEVLSTQFDMGRRIVSAPGDGGILLLPSNDPSGPVPISTYNAADRTFAASSTTTTATTQASQSRNGSRVILTSFALTPSQVSAVYDAPLYVLAGTLPSELNGVVISADGTKAYAYFSITNTVRKFDLDTSDGNGGFVEIGPGTPVADLPGTDFVQMALTPDDSYLFIAGNQHFIVMPAP